MPVLEKIVISDFRNIQLQELEFSPNINCISGNNGEGKTNLLDAVYYLSMTKSAFSSSDRFNFRHGTDEFSLSGVYRMENGLSSRFAVKMSSKGEKKVRRDDKTYVRVSEHIGVLPIVMVSPADISVLFPVLFVPLCSVFSSAHAQSNKHITTSKIESFFMMVSPLFVTFMRFVNVRTGFYRVLRKIHVWQAVHRGFPARRYVRRA